MIRKAKEKANTAWRRFIELATETAVGKETLDVLLADLMAAKYAEGYAQALLDFSQGVRYVPPSILVNVAPAINQMQGKLKKMRK
jgi:hypothetical protein